MRLCIPAFGIDYLIEENFITNLVVESPELFTKFISDIKSQKVGNNGEEIFVYADKNISLSKIAEIIIDPFEIDCNDRKILNKIYSELAEDINTNKVEEYSELNSKLIEFADNIINDSVLSLSSDDNIEVSGILKLLNIRVVDDGDDLSERMINYLRLINSIFNIEIVFFCNLKLFFSKEQYRNICEFCMYQKMKIINLEGINPYSFDFEKTITIDNDLCIIYC